MGRLARAASRPNAPPPRDRRAADRDHFDARHSPRLRQQWCWL